VAKKKYLAMETAKISAEKEVAAQNQKIEGLIADFEVMKNRLMENNAIKNQSIDSLSGAVNRLMTAVSSKESALGDKENSFEFERQRLTAELAEQKKLFSGKQNEMNQISGELQKLKDELSQMTFDLNKTRDEKSVVQGNLDDREKQISELNTSADKLKAEIQSLKKQLSDKKETITRLENNVKLLKKEIK
jgi:chromosome segregation ATPase